MISRDEAHLLFVSFIVIGLLFYQLYFSYTSYYYNLSPSVVTKFFEQYIYIQFLSLASLTKRAEFQFHLFYLNYTVMALGTEMKSMMVG